MTLWNVPLPNLSLIAQHHALRVEQARILATIILETDDAPLLAAPGLKPAGDEGILRCIPVQGVEGVAGVIPRTRPDHINFRDA